MAAVDFLSSVGLGARFDMVEKTEQLPKSPKSAAQIIADRRADPRYKFAAAARVVDKKSGAKVESRVSDLSREGCFVDAPQPFPLGTIVTLRITKDVKSFEAGARVVFSSVGKGMGLFFMTIDPAQRVILDEWLSSTLETSWLASTRRRSQRILIKFPVRVQGKNRQGVAFDEETYTQAASAHGALILLSATVKKGQRLTLFNKQTKGSMECIVAHLGDVQDNLTQVGVEFVLPNPAFWNATFPPEDWSVRHVDAKSKSNVR